MTATRLRAGLAPVLVLLAAVASACGSGYGKTPLPAPATTAAPAAPSAAAAPATCDDPLASYAPEGPLPDPTALPGRVDHGPDPRTAAG